MDIISDMKLTVSSLDSKEALSNTDKVYMDYVTSNLHASICEKNKLRVYRELKEVCNFIIFFVTLFIFLKSHYSSKHQSWKDFCNILLLLFCLQEFCCQILF